MKRSLLVLALETSAKAIRTGFGVVGSLVDCGMPGPKVRDALWLTAAEEEIEVWEAPLSADFDDEPNPLAPLVDRMDRYDAIISAQESHEAFRRSQTPAQMPAQLAAVRSRKAPEEAHPPAASSGVLNGVPTFQAMQDICRGYVDEHFYRVTRPSFRVVCGCGIELSDYEAWLDHVTELQASALSFAIAEARNAQ